MSGSDIDEIEAAEAEKRRLEQIALEAADKARVEEEDQARRNEESEEELEEAEKADEVAVIDPVLEGGEKELDLEDVAAPGSPGRGARRPAVVPLGAAAASGALAPTSTMTTTTRAASPAVVNPATTIPAPSANAKHEQQKSANTNKGPKAEMTKSKDGGMKYEDNKDSSHPHSIGGRMFKALMDGWWSLSPIIGAVFTRPACVVGGLVAGVGALPVAVGATLLGVGSGLTGLVVDKARGTDKFNGPNGFTKSLFNMAGESAFFGFKNIFATIPNTIHTVVAGAADLSLYFTAKPQDWLVRFEKYIPLTGYANTAFEEALNAAKTSVKQADGTYKDVWNNDWAFYNKAARKMAIGNKPREDSLDQELTAGKIRSAAVAPEDSVRKGPTITTQSPGMDDDDNEVEIHKPEQSKAPRDAFQEELLKKVPRVRPREPSLSFEAERSELERESQEPSTQEPARAASLALNARGVAPEAAPDPTLTLQTTGATSANVAPASPTGTGGTLTLNVVRPEVTARATRVRDLFGPLFSSKQTQVPQHHASTGLGMHTSLGMHAASANGSLTLRQIAVNADAKDEPAVTAAPSLTLRSTPSN